MQITITALKDTERTSARTGKPFTSRGIQCNEYPGKWLSGFAGKDNEGWKVGDTVDIEVETKGEYLNFKTPKSTHQTAATGFKPTGDLLRVETKLDSILAGQKTLGGILTDIRGVMGDILSKIDKVDTEDPNFP